MSLASLPPLHLDGTAIPLEVDALEAERFFVPLARYLLDRLPPGRRFVAGIAGPPASGKSAFTQLLAAVVNALAGTQAAVHVGLDGWHFPNAYLDSHTILREGVEIPLRKIKGSPPSFDVPAMLAFLRKVCSGHNPPYPLYSRALHDPEPGGQIQPGHRLILVEGNYLLVDQPPWTGCQELFDLTLFLTAPREILLQSMYARHLRGGKAPPAIEAHMAFTDLPNLDLVINHSKPGDLTVQKQDSRKILKIIYPDIG